MDIPLNYQLFLADKVKKLNPKDQADAIDDVRRAISGLPHKFSEQGWFGSHLCDICLGSRKAH